MNGYLSPLYAQSLAEFGTPRELPLCGGWILERPIPGFPQRDAMGCYPLFACRDWSKLNTDLDNINNELVSLALVADPFGVYDLSNLKKCFDVVVPFKEHFVIDLRATSKLKISRHHRYYAHRSLRDVSVEVGAEPKMFVDDWMDLYTNLIRKHNLNGIKAFSRAAFAKQFCVPGIVVLRAVHKGVTSGMQLWYVEGEVGYSHLTAVSPLGYELRASYAIYSAAIEHFSDKVNWLDLGAGGGISSPVADGLSEFKRGWSNGTRTTYFCGRIFDQRKYDEIVKASGMPLADYFPAYRKGEFA
jgi:hypothetical protein